MATVVLVHGIGNQYSGENELLSDWYPALCDGLKLAGVDPPDLIDCACAFYGGCFRPQGHLGTADRINIENASPDEIELLEQVWSEAARAEPQNVPAPEEFECSLARTPQIVQRALNALAQSEYCSNRFPLQVFGDLKQVVKYLDDSDTHGNILSRVVSKLGTDTKVVVGHSLNQQPV